MPTPPEKPGMSGTCQEIPDLSRIGSDVVVLGYDHQQKQFRDVLNHGLQVYTKYISFKRPIDRIIVTDTIYVL